MKHFLKPSLIAALLTSSASAWAAGPKCIDEDSEIINSQFKEGWECRNDKDTLKLSIQFFYVGDDIECASFARLQRLGDGPGSSKVDFHGVGQLSKGLNINGYTFGGSGELNLVGKTDSKGFRKAELKLGRETISVRCKDMDSGE